MKMQICLALAALVLGTVQSHIIMPRNIPVYLTPEEMDSGLSTSSRLRRSPEGTVDLSAIVGPGREAAVDAKYKQEVWKGRHGESLELHGGYTGQFGHGKPDHNFGIGGTLRF